MLITELLDSKIDYTVLRSGKDQFMAKAKVGKRTIEFSADYYDDLAVWDVSFAERVKGYITTEKTGSGNELEVFALIKDLILEFIKKYDPIKFEFEAHKEDIDDPKNTRANLYARLVNKFKIPGYKIERLQGRRRDKFVITKDQHAA